MHVLERPGSDSSMSKGFVHVLHSTLHVTYDSNLLPFLSLVHVSCSLAFYDPRILWLRSFSIVHQTLLNFHARILISEVETLFPHSLCYDFYI